MFVDENIISVSYTHLLFLPTLTKTFRNWVKLLIYFFYAVDICRYFMNCVLITFFTGSKSKLILSADFGWTHPAGLNSCSKQNDVGLGAANIFGLGGLPLLDVPHWQIFKAEQRLDCIPTFYKKGSIRDVLWRPLIIKNLCPYMVM